MEPSERQKWLVRSVRRWGVGDMRSRYYIVAHAIRVAPKLNFDRLNRSFQEVVAARDTLRSTFSGHGDAVVVSLLPTDAFCVRRVDATDSEAHARALLEDEVNEVIDPQSDPLVALTMIECEASTILLLRFHHTVIDGWSASIFIREILLSYIVGAAPQAEKATFADFVAHERAHMRSPQGADELDYWCAQLSDLPPRLKLPYDRPDHGDYASGFYVSDVVDETTSASIAKIAQEWSVSNFALLMGVFNTLIWTLTGEGEAPISVAAANRGPARFRETIGWFANAVFVRTDISPDSCVAEICRRHHAVLQEALERQQIPSSVVQDVVEANFPGHVTALDQVSFGVVIPNAGDTLGLTSILNQPPGKVSRWGEFECEVLDFRKEECARDMSFFVHAGDVIHISANCRGDVFDVETGREILWMYTEMLRAIAAQPDQTAQDLKRSAERTRSRLVWSEESC